MCFSAKHKQSMRPTYFRVQNLEKKRRCPWGNNLGGFCPTARRHEKCRILSFAKKINSRVYGGIKTPPLHYGPLNRACKKKFFFATFMTSVSQNLCQISTDFYLDRFPRAPNESQG